MSTGIGKTQQRILATLTEDQDHLALTVADLAQRIGCSNRQIRRAVRSLEDRGLVAITREYLGWKGTGEYGPLRWVCDQVDDPDGDHTRYEGSHWGIPQEGDEISARAVTRKDGTRFILGTPVKYRQKWRQEASGMPRFGLWVWLPERRLAWLERNIDTTTALGRELGLGPKDHERLAEKIAEHGRLTNLLAASQN